MFTHINLGGVLKIIPELNIEIRDLWDPREPYFIIYTFNWVIQIINMEKIKWHCFIRIFGGPWRPWVARCFLTHVMN